MHHASEPSTFKICFEEKETFIAIAMKLDFQYKMFSLSWVYVWLENLHE